MTTKVKIEIVRSHRPIAVEVLDSGGAIQYTLRMADIGQYIEEYVHSGQTLRVREMSNAEQHESGG